jgi:ribosomal protein S18 acetylase RimI-like enzyme
MDEREIDLIDLHAQQIAKQRSATASAMPGSVAILPMGADASSAAAEHRVALLDETQCRTLETFLVDRIYEFNSHTTGYFDGRLLGGRVENKAGEVIAGVSGHTWGSSCEISNLWVDERHRGRGLGRTLLDTAEAEALGRGCAQIVVITHSFQAPDFYEHLGYERKCAIEDHPKGHSDIVLIKRLEHPVRCGSGTHVTRADSGFVEDCSTVVHTCRV